MDHIVIREGGEMDGFIGQGVVGNMCDWKKNKKKKVEGKMTALKILERRGAFWSQFER